MSAGRGPSRLDRTLATVERWGNRLPDPAFLFVVLLVVVWIVSALLAPVEFAELDPRTRAPLRIENLLSGKALAAFLAGMVTTFTGFHPLGVVLVAMLGVGVAEQTGFIDAGLKAFMARVGRRLLTPAVLLGSIVSHTAADAGYVLVIPLAGVIFHAAGRHPLAGIAAAFAGVSGGFGANFIPSSLDPLLSALTQSAAQVVDPGRLVNPLCNWGFTAASSLFIIAVCWYLTDKVIEPRLANVPLDALPSGPPANPQPDANANPSPAAAAGASSPGTLTAAERRGLLAALASFAASGALLVIAAAPATSPLRSATGSLTDTGAPLMDSIVPLIFLLFVIPGAVYGYVAGTVQSHRDIVKGMARVMSTMGYYLVLAFFASLFIGSFGKSNLGALLALKGAAVLQALALPGGVTIVAVVLLVAVLNMFIGSASAKWALIGPILVPMLMQLGLSPELTQAAYRVGDSTTNVITPLMPYFPLVVVYAARWVKNPGIGTVASLMLPFAAVLLVGWTAFLLLYWAAGVPLGLQAPYHYPG
jgi:aminobenzoyl-glutamate transport protein